MITNNYHNINVYKLGDIKLSNKLNRLINMPYDLLYTLYLRFTRQAVAILPNFSYISKNPECNPNLELYHQETIVPLSSLCYIIPQLPTGYTYPGALDSPKRAPKKGHYTLTQWAVTRAGLGRLAPANFRKIFQSDAYITSEYIVC